MYNVVGNKYLKQLFDQYTKAFLKAGEAADIEAGICHGDKICVSCTPSFHVPVTVFFHQFIHCCLKEDNKGPINMLFTDVIICLIIIKLKLLL